MRLRWRLRRRHSRAARHAAHRGHRSWRGAPCAPPAQHHDSAELHAGWRHAHPSWRARWFKVRLQRRIFLTLALCAGLGFALGRGLLFGPDQRAWPLIAIVFVASVGSGGIAWYLTRPLLLVVRAARDLGAGKLDRRISLRGGDEIAFLAASLNDMADRIAEKLREQRALLAAVSHELRTPLGHMRILLETARERGEPQAALAQLEHEVAELDRLVARLLASSRLEFGQLEGQRVALGELAAEVALAHGIDAEAISVEGETTLRVEPTLVRRALANLLENAQRHGGGAVALRVHGTRERATIEVDDAGPGVAPERRADAFAAFVPSSAGGLGLGLALVQRIALAHGGQAWITDRPGGGARVGFSLGNLPPGGAAPTP